MQNQMTEHVYTSQGYLSQERQGLQTTKRKDHDIFHKTDNEINREIEGLKRKANVGQSMTEILNEDIIKDAFLTSESPNNNKIM